MDGCPFETFACREMMPSQRYSPAAGRLASPADSATGSGSGWGSGRKRRGGRLLPGDPAAKRPR